MQEQSNKKSEKRALVFLTVFLAPLLAVAVVGGVGLVTWLLQIYGGPPAG